MVRRGRGGAGARASGHAAWRRSCAASTSRTFAPHLDVGDHVVVVNAEKVHLTGRKLHDKHVPLALRLHRRPARGAGGDRCSRPIPERVIEWAVQGMLPKNRLGRAMAKKLKVYRGAAHPHQAQQPEACCRPGRRAGDGSGTRSRSTGPDGARPPWPACGSGPAPAGSSSTGGRSRTTSRARRCA